MACVGAGQGLSVENVQVATQSQGPVSEAEEKKKAKKARQRAARAQAAAQTAQVRQLHQRHQSEVHVLAEVLDCPVITCCRNHSCI